MSTHPTLAPAALRRAALVLFALLVLSLVGRFVFTLWEPPFDGSLHFGDIAPLGDSYWAMNLYLGGPSYAISFVATAVFLVMLGRGRSSLLTLAGGVLVLLGGLVFSLAIVAESWPFALAANPAVLSPDEGAEAFDVLNSAAGPLFPAILGGQIVVALGATMGLIGMLIARTAPRWLPIAGLAYILLFQVLPFEQLGGRAVTIVSYVLQLLLLAGIAVAAIRLRPSTASHRSAASDSPVPATTP